MFCTKCGAELPDGVKFCTSCGAQTSFVSAPAAPAAPAAPVTPAAPAANGWQQPRQPQADGWQQPQQPQTDAWQQPRQPQTDAWQQPRQPQTDAWQQPRQPQTDAWQQPRQPQTDAWQQPQQPQANAWQQPQQPQANAWQQPQQPQANSWQQQQPQQWQKIQQQWQEQQIRQQQAQPQQVQQWQQQARQQAQQWQQPQQPQPQQWQQPARGGSHAAPQTKKKGKGGLIAAIAAVLVVAVGVGGFVWPGFFKGGKTGKTGSSGGTTSTVLAEKFSTPEEYYQAVETNSAADLASHVSSTYDNIFLSNASSEDICASGTLKIEPGDKLRELVRDLAGEQLDQLNPGDDLKWLKSAALTYDLSRKGDLGMFNAGVQLNGTDIAHVKAVIEIENGVVYLSVPELSDKYLKTTLEDLNLDSINLPSSLNFDSVLGGITPEDAEKLDPVVDALPDANTVDKTMNKYLSEAVELIEDVKKETGTLTAEDVSAEYTVLTSTITPDTAVKIVQKLGPELKEDKDVKKVFLEVASAAGEDGEAKYKEFTDKIDELLNDPSKITEKIKENIVVTVYLDKSGDVHGRIVDGGSWKLELLMPEKSGQFALTVRLTQDGAEKLLLSGSGKRNGDKLTGDLDLTVDGEFYAVLGLDGFDIEKAKDGYFVGAVNVKPTASLWDKVTGAIGGEDGEVTLPESVKSLLDSLVIRLDMNTSKDKASVTLTLSNGSDKLISIAVEGAKSAAKKISPVEGIEPSEWAGDITLDKLEKVVASIEKAGVPTAYTDLLDEALDSAYN